MSSLIALLVEHILDWPFLGFVLVLLVLVVYRDEVRSLSRRAGRIKVGQVEVDLAHALQRQDELRAADIDELRRQIQWLAHHIGHSLPLIAQSEHQVANASALPAAETMSGFDVLCNEYTSLSSQLDFGQKRSLAHLLADAGQTAQFSPDEYLRYGSEGHVLGAALWLQSHPDPTRLGSLLAALERIRSNFVRYRLVDALDALLPYLDDEACKHLSRALRRLTVGEALDEQLALRISMLMERI